MYDNQNKQNGIQHNLRVCVCVYVPRGTFF